MEAEKLQTLFDSVEVMEAPWSLLIYNDDVNTFDHVIETLIRVCKHTREQAEQCTSIIHYKGKCVVKEGPLEKLQSMCSAICEAGINAVVV